MKNTSKMECESETGNTKISDSAYSTSFCKSNSHGSASSKSLLSGSNCSSGYGGVVKSGTENDDINGQIPNKRNKDKDHKKSKLQSTDENHVDVTGTNSIKNGVIDNQDNLGFESFTSNNITSTNDEENGSLDAALDNNVEQSEIVPSDDPIDKINTTEPKNGFCCVTSMYDGIVLYTSPSLTSVLGFPNNMWLGRSFSDFLHPKDRDTFSNQITNGVAIPIIDGVGKTEDVQCSFYACLRKYRGLKTSGYRVVEKVVSYQAFHLSVTLKHASESVNSICLHNSKDTFLIILAVPVYSYYKVPDEMKKSSKFGMRHTASCIFSQVDADVVMNFGYLPQEMLGKSVFDFYHPEDLPFLKEVYESIMVKCQITGSVYRSKPYRFAVQNGDFVMVETEWSCFINPWSRRLEFVIGLHRVLQGPTNPDVFGTPKDEKYKFVSDEVLKEAKVLREEILRILNKELSRPSKLAKQEVSKRCKNLATFMETVIVEVSKSNIHSNSLCNHDAMVSELKDVNLSDTSPRNDYYDRESSSETPPSYNQLNYNDNINRFFKSKPMTNASYESERPISAAQGATDTDQEMKSSSAVQTSNQVSNSGSTGNFSSGSNPNIECGNTSATNTSNGSYEPLLLTEELILRHNEDMEKMMRQRHREYRFSMKAVKENKRNINKNEKNTDKTHNNEKLDQQGSVKFQGIKRSGSFSCEEDNYKILKHKHQVYGKMNEARSSSNTNCASKFTGACNGTNGTEKDTIPAINDLPLWPPFSVTMAPLSSTQSFGANSGTNTTGMFPVYYIPTQQGKSTTDYNETYTSPNYQVQYMPGVVYNPVFPTSPIFCSPMAMVPFSVPQPVTPLVSEIKHGGAGPPNDFKTNSPRGSISKFQRPASQATSVKAEPGSALGSIASASCVNRTAETVEEKFVDHVPQDEESSYSSFYSSFLKTDTGSGSNDDSNAETNRNSKNNSSNEKDRRSQPIKKCDPSWMEAVIVTPELVYRYQMSEKNLKDVLQSDMKALESLNQPQLVNDQLDQLYLAMEMEGIPTNLNLQEQDSSSDSDDECNTCQSTKLRKKRASYSTLMMIYEEDAPLPSPDL
ncbi:hypothetical protein RN001_007685 [Aquatica leii]|uniref:Period circadian protein n=1 Tax=Aquatica leii TaxID=1421715 RepID=A0AAN7SGX7_9COLE|nr:hypothetical protein RN001_007685 [Aquatica leii]